MTQSEINIYKSNGTTLTTIGVYEGAKAKFTLGSEDYIMLPFVTLTPIAFGIGDYVNLAEVLDSYLGGIFSKRYEIITIPSPTYDTETGGYRYELRLDAYYMSWQNKLFKYLPTNGAKETSWNLTAALNVHMNVFNRNLQDQEITYNGEPYTCDIDYSVVKDTAKLLSYSDTNLIDALTMMAEAWECEWWVTENVIHFGRLEHSDSVEITIGVEASEMTRSDSAGTFATRLYVFGSERNLPRNYRPTSEAVTVDGIVQRRLMLPGDIPYIDAYRYRADGSKVYVGENGYDNASEMPRSEAVEAVIATDDIYPRTNGEIASVTKYWSYELLDSNGEGTGKFRTLYEWSNELEGKDYQVFYRFTDESITFSKDYLLQGVNLSMQFTGGNLNGMTYELAFNPLGKAEKNADGSWNSEAQLFEIVANAEYGRTLPDNVLKPEPGDTYVLQGWDSTKIASLGLVAAAETELYNYGVEYVKKTAADDGTYDTTLMSNWVYSDLASHMFTIGQRISLVNNALFSEPRQSRIIGYEINIDKPYNAPQYSIGESVQYSRINAIESKVEEIIYNGKSFISGEGGSSVYVIRVNDSTAPSDTNTYSAKRANIQFINKTQNDSAPHHYMFGSILVGELVEHGGEIVEGD